MLVSQVSGLETLHELAVWGNFALLRWLKLRFDTHVHHRVVINLILSFVHQLLADFDIMRPYEFFIDLSGESLVLGRLSEHTLESLLWRPNLLLVPS
mmetsp:Transcript_42412/g.55926  ORF Transcript_42412/g.55926 Transcript_42412/m.55926 type:complete len:97 (+) Transcript_42412:2361-2651(+)